MLHNFDTYFISVVDSWPRWLEGLMHALSFIGQPLVTITILAGIGIYGLWRRKRAYFTAALIALVTFVINSIIKATVRRDRPSTYVPPDDLLKSYSFPSGHSVGAMLAFGLLAYIIWTKFPNKYVRIATVIVATLLIIGVGVSRVYLGAHYPSDVVAGWTLGIIGIAIIIWKVRLR